jgi:hypothetical protein
MVKTYLPLMPNPYGLKFNSATRLVIMGCRHENEFVQFENALCTKNSIQPKTGQIYLARSAA